MGKLYVVATPIGNLEDMTLRAIRVLKEVGLIAAEDTRTTAHLLARHDIHTPTTSLFEHNEPVKLEKMLAALEEGDVAMVSEAGMPLLSDPGYRLAVAAIEGGFEVVCVPGASAVTAAIVVSGIPANRFHFLGFLPRRRGERLGLLEEVANLPCALVCFEAPHRLVDSLEDAAKALGGERRVAVCREMTKLHEETWRGTLEEAAREFTAREPRGEFTLVIEGPTHREERWPADKVRRELELLVADGLGIKEASKVLSRRCGWQRREIYALAHEEEESGAG